MDSILIHCKLSSEKGLLNILGGESVAFMFALLCPENIDEIICRVQCDRKHELNCQSPFLWVNSSKGLNFQKPPELHNIFGTRSSSLSQLSVKCALQFWRLGWIPYLDPWAFLSHLCFKQLFQNLCPWVCTLHLFLLFFVAVNIASWVSMCQVQAPGSEALMGALCSGLLSRTVKNALLLSPHFI